MKKLDFKGLSCPKPVIDTKKYIDENPMTDSLCVVVDNKAAAENVTRLLSSQGYAWEISGEKNEFQVVGSRTGSPDKGVVTQHNPAERTTLVMFSHNTIGTGNKELGAKLMLNFIKTLSEIKDTLWRLVFVNEAVKLTIKDSETVMTLKDLEKDGVSILVCGTCLEYYNLMDDKGVGETTNMLDIMTSMQVAGKIINI